MSKSEDTIVIKFDAINRLNKSLKDLLMAESLSFNTEQINVNDWVNKTDNKKLDQDVQQNYNESVSEMTQHDST